MKGQSLGRRLGYALNGLRLATRQEKSLRTHLLATVAVVLVLSLTRASALWWAVMALTVGLVIVAELINSALETLIDHLHPERHPAIGAAKDIAAGATLLASVVALVVGASYLVDWLGR
ncbi:MAG TPA: diacylglycerol kinase [Aquabacterium sp.]|jgi:diacylglycerol kinase (ATP)|uniref:diacylglycerol kinase n=1 Tax=Aquabacterium sp. TaxID=1872578 RepID=UPI002E3547BA|nr:diacylglycerol kinase [Aquabacterium sp.]HEX5355786.1 diacylglycerol kinase [Aquabacterium sp.]